MRRRARRHRHRGLVGFGHLRLLGPGIVTGAADDDPSGIGTYSQVGASFRFGLLWTAPVTLPLAAAVQETCARLGLVTGKGLAALIRARFSRAVLYPAVALVAVANVFNIGADLGSMAASVRLLVPAPFVLLIVAMGVATILLEVLVPYHRYAKVLRWLACSIVAYVAVLFVIHVRWATVARNTFVPSFSFSRTRLAALIAILGTTISPYLFFWQTSEEVEDRHEHEEHPEHHARHLREMRIDVVAGMISAVAVMFAIMVASGATLGAHGATTVQSADQAARALKPLAGSVAQLLFALGIVGTGALAVPVLAGSTAYAVAETFGWREGLSRKLRDARAFYATIAVAVGVGLAMNFAGVNPIRALYYSAILNGLVAPPLLVITLLLARSRHVMGGHASGRVSIVLVSVAAAAMTALPIAYLAS